MLQQPTSEEVSTAAKENKSLQNIERTQQRALSEQSEKELDEKIRRIREQNALLEERRRQALAEEQSEESKKPIWEGETRTSNSREWRGNDKLTGNKLPRAPLQAQALAQAPAVTSRDAKGRFMERRTGSKHATSNKAEDGPPGWRTVARSNR
jgi:hypothetical protein